LNVVADPEWRHALCKYTDGRPCRRRGGKTSNLPVKVEKKVLQVLFHFYTATNTEMIHDPSKTFSRKLD